MSIVLGNNSRGQTNMSTFPLIDSYGYTKHSQPTVFLVLSHWYKYKELGPYWFLPLGHTWPMGYWRSLRHLSVCLSVCLSIQFLLAYIYYWHQTITAYLPCPVLVAHTIILALRPLTLVWWPLPLLCLLLQNCLNEASHQCQNSTLAAFCQYLRWVRKAVMLVEL